MKKCIIYIAFLLMCSTVFAQNDFRKNDVYFEFLGNGILASINYERQLGSTPGLGARIGIGHFSGDEQFRISIPVGINYLIKLNNNRSFLDAGIGATWSGAAGLKTSKQESLAGGRDYSEKIWSFIPSIGYRRHTKGHFMWRASLTPVFNKYRTLPWVGISIGKRL
ncbi:MAG TPA: hypothetical protein VGD17_17070 [Chitinophagaceae bacterium]